ncbi:MAG TPA: FtsX-like permease family protein, partial [Longimicrobiales bacterium]|nr:FtsX-like permease family protein [Longimicrobiales bacterium]
VLISGAVLFARSFQVARTQDLGFETTNRLVLQVNLRAQGYSEDEGVAFLPRALERLAALPGVEEVVVSRMIPFQGDWSTEIEPPPGARPNTEDGQLAIGLNTVSPGYFDLMGIPLVEGRAFNAQDTQGGPSAIILNEALESLLFPEGGAVGQTLTLRSGDAFEVVGVARNSAYYELGEDPPTQLYRSIFQAYQPRIHFVLETRGDAASLAPAAQAALRELDPDLTFPWVSTLASIFEDQTARFRVSAVLVGVFSLLALILAATGLYGVISFLVAQRTREIGVRMALGADRGRIAGEVLRTGLGLAAVGLVLGLAGAVAARRLTTALLFGAVRAEDPWPLLAGCLTLAVVAAAASVIPARRATRVDPMEAIRAD